MKLNINPGLPSHNFLFSLLWKHPTIMKPKLLLLFAFILFDFSIVYAQCTIDYSQTVPGVYPDTLPDATANQSYSEDVTFVLLPDTLGLTIYNYEIVSIVGLPIGLSWQCNNFANGCNYDPAVSLYGCINVSGTPILAGNYMATVNLVVDIQIVGNQTVTYDVPIIVQPGVVNNPGFSMTNSIGCEPLTVTFTNNNPGQASYLWDFGNGLQSTLENPPPQVYSTPGTYIVTQTVMPNTPPDYFLTAITVNSIPNNFGAPIDDPDMYFLLTNQAGNTIYDSSPSLNAVFPPYTWTLPNIQLNNENYTVHVWDEDGGLFGADDDLGAISFAGWGPSGNATGTVGGASGTLNVDYTIFQIPVNPLIETDTIYVYPVPAAPVVSASGPLSICAGDSVVLTCSDSVGVQWYENGVFMVGDTSQSLVVTSPGDYSATVTNSFGCTASSAVSTVIVHPLPPQPNFSVNLNVFTTGLTGYTLQWYLNGVAIPGATGYSYTAPVGGTYTLEACDANGCCNLSDSVFLSLTGLATLQSSILSLSIMPNPSNGLFHVQFETTMTDDAVITVHDMVGQTVYSENFSVQNGINKKQLNLHELKKGYYMLSVKQNNPGMSRKIIKSE